MSSSAGRVLMIPKGEYNSSTQYYQLDVVLYNGDSYVAKQNTIGNAPTNTTYWQPMTTAAEDVNSLKETLTNFEESITGKVVDSEPYVLRQGKGNMVDFSIVGGSIAWNQLIKNGNFVNTNNWGHFQNDWSVSDNILTLTSTATGADNNVCIYGYTFDLQANHKMLLSFDILYEKNITSGECNIATTDWSTNIVKSFSATANIWKRNEFLITKENSVSSLRFLIYPFKNPTASVGDVVKIRNVQFIDLTQLFGSSTIADYIYSLEQATAGAGVAWFRQYFPNAYYAYNVGEIESVNVGARIASKNLFNPDKFVRGLLNSADGSVTGSNQWITSDYIPIFDNTKITVSAWAEKGEKCFWVRFCQYDKDKNFISNASNQDVSGNTYWSNPKTLDSRTKYVRLTFGFDNKDITVSSFFATNDIQLEYGENGSNYEAYGKYTFPFDSSKQLRGIPKLVDNKLSYDGDIYTADGTVTRKYGIVDLGSLTYSKDNNNAFYATLSSAVTGVIGTTMNGICSNGYQVVQTKGSVADILAQGDNIFAMQSGSKLLYIKDTSKASMTTTEFKTAMSGIYLVYELATPTTESATPYQNPQRAFIDGTEEFVDYGVQSATRDVSIPVGNNTTYQLNETLPPTEDYVDGALKFKAAISAFGTDESGRTTASRAYTTGEFFYKDGKMYKVLTSIAQGATFTVGTNCQQTTLFAELKALAQ